MKEDMKIVDDNIVTTFSEDVAPELEQALAERNSKLHCERFPRERTFHRVAYIPASVIVEMYRRGINFLNPDETDQKKIKELLNDEFSKLKTVDAKL